MSKLSFNGAMKLLQASGEFELPNVKRCCKCKEIKGSDLFSKDRVMCKDCCSIIYGNWAGRNTENRKKSVRKHKLMKFYGLTEDQYISLWEKQNGLCAICKVDGNSLARKLHVDHDHLTGIVRGLLCTNCNTGIGQFKDNVHLLAQAQNYMEQANQG